MLASNFDWNMIFGMPNVFLVFGIGFGSLIAIIGIVAGTWEKVQRNRSLVDLKLLLIERGLSADEIDKIISAKPEGSSLRDKT
jgi:hypothetical protein